MFICMPPLWMWLSSVYKEEKVFVNGRIGFTEWKNDETSLSWAWWFKSFRKIKKDTIFRWSRSQKVPFWPLRWGIWTGPPRNIVVRFPSLHSVGALLISRLYRLPPSSTGSGRRQSPRRNRRSGSILPNKQKRDYLSIISFYHGDGGIWTGPPRNIVVYSPSLRSVGTLLISRSFELPLSATGSGRSQLPRRARFQFFW